MGRFFLWLLLGIAALLLDSGALGLVFYFWLFASFDWWQIIVSWALLNGGGFSVLWLMERRRLRNGITGAT